MHPELQSPITDRLPQRRRAARVLDLKQLSSTGYELTIERGDLPFTAGQLITIHGPSVLEDRSYTISSGEQDNTIQVLFRKIPTGKLTPRLAGLSPGDALEISGPFGEFVLRDPTRPVVFIATGTGVAPCRAYLRTRSDLRVTLVHGVRLAEDLFYRDEFAGRTAYHPCVSGEDGFGFRGRVTDLCRDLDFDPDSHFYLCGANEMFYDMRDLLEARGVDAHAIFTEAYYYRSDE
jgi:ferredoxin--NADP+ reductase/benzoate/toluate 1,2-dioxygenase reductase subunit